MQQKTLNNRYELEQKIGEGGMARVYRGRDTRLNRRIAVKVLHSHYASDPNFVQRFHHEAQAAANLRHPNVVDVYDVGQDGDIHYIVMEYVDGSDLKSILVKNGPLPIEQAVAIAEAVAQGLSAAHRIGLVHRDIKPQNIIVGPNNQVKITDFGIAKSAFSTAMTETGVTFGTADYLSPEQAKGQQATPQSDIYSLGVTLFEMLTGRLPFVGDSSIAVAMQHVTEEPPLPRMYNPRIPPALESLVLRALSKDPNARPASAQEFARMLSNWKDLGQQATVVRPAVPRPAQPRPAPARPVQPRPAPPPSVNTGRMNLPPARPAISAQPPPSNRGLGFGGFLLGLLLLAGVLGLIYLGASGIFSDLLNFTAGTPPQPRPTADVISQPTPTTTEIPMVQVPDLSGLTSAQARSTIESANLISREETSRYHDDIPIGLVIDQFPLAGTTITSTSVVTFAVSLGPEPILMPDVVGLRASDAQARLIQLGFQVEMVEQASQTMDAGFVIRSEPGPNTRPLRGDTITLYVSIGDVVRIPDVTGMQEAEAREVIQAAGLFVSFVDYQGPDKIENFDSIPPGTVVSSVPRGGDLVERNTGVTLGVRQP